MLSEGTTSTIVLSQERRSSLSSFLDVVHCAASGFRTAEILAGNSMQRLWVLSFIK